jgi:hypothetical protein
MAEICGLPNARTVRAYADDVERRLDANELPGAD